MPVQGPSLRPRTLEAGPRSVKSPGDRREATLATSACKRPVDQETRVRDRASDEAGARVGRKSARYQLMYVEERF